MQEQTEQTLVALGDLEGFKVAQGYPDIRGWDVYGADSTRLGEIEDLVVDRNVMKARYMIVKLDQSLPGLGEARSVIVPVGRARLDDELDRAYLDDVNATEATTLPEYRAEDLTAGREEALFGQGVAREGFYDRPEYDTGRLFGKRGAPDEAFLRRHEEEMDVGRREVKAGEVVLQEHVDTEHAAQKVPLRHEEVTVERRPLPEGQAPGGVSVTEEEVRVPIKAEEPVVEKRVVAKEEVVVKKVPVETEKVVEADLRKQRIDVDRVTPEGRSEPVEVREATAPAEAVRPEEPAAAEKKPEKEPV